MKKNNYNLLNERHEKEVEDFTGLAWAFGNEQFEEALKTLRCTPADLISIGSGGLLLKNRLADFEAMITRHSKETKELLNNKKELFKALVYELNNHEFCYTGDPSDALDALGLTIETIDNNLLNRAKQQSLKDCDEY